MIFNADLPLSKTKNGFGAVLSTPLLLTVTVTLPLPRLGAVHKTKLDERKRALVCDVPNLQPSECEKSK